MFGQEYISSRKEYLTLEDFYRDYDPPLLPGRYTCVGLACDLATRLSALEVYYPGLKDATYQVSCEEEVDNVDWYCSGSVPPVNTCEKEHVLICVRIRVAGRAGVLLLDPGYHIGEAITVMEDGMMPQSGAISARTTRPEVVRTYRYHYYPENPSFVTWNVVEQRDGQTTREHTSLIHVARPFLSGIDVAERRNLAYPFKTLVGRNSMGHLICGLYFPLRDCTLTLVTLFHQVVGVPHHIKVPLSYFLKGNQKDVNLIDEEAEVALKAVAFGLGRGTDDLRNTLAAVAHLLSDQDLIQELAQLNEAIDSISKDN